MTVDQARAELKKVLDEDRYHPDSEEFVRVLDQYVQAVIAECLEGYQRKPLMFR